MRRLELIEHDRVVDDYGNSGIVTQCTRSDGSGTRFLSVRITEGPAKLCGQASWGKLYHFRPLLDSPGGTIPTVCLECERPFKATVDRVLSTPDKQYPREDQCRTCRGPQRPARAGGSR